MRKNHPMRGELNIKIAINLLLDINSYLTLEKNKLNYKSTNSLHIKLPTNA